MNLFSKEIVIDEEGLTMSILDKLYLENPANLNLYQSEKN